MISGNGNELRTFSIVAGSVAVPGINEIDRYESLIKMVMKTSAKTPADQIETLQKEIEAMASFCSMGDIAVQRFQIEEDKIMRNLEEIAARDERYRKAEIDKAKAEAKAAGKKWRSKKMSKTAQAEAEIQARRAARTLEEDQRRRRSEAFFAVAREVAEVACQIYYSWPPTVAQMVIGGIVNYNVAKGYGHSLKEAISDLNTLLREVDSDKEGWRMERAHQGCACGHCEPDLYIVGTEEYRKKARQESEGGSLVSSLEEIFKGSPLRGILGSGGGIEDLLDLMTRR